MKAQTFGALLGSVILVSLALACERGNSPAAPTAPTAPSAAAASRINGSVVHSSVSANADREGEENGGCTKASLEGAYGLYRNGTESGAPVAAIGLATFDGTGAVASARQTIRRNGVTTSDLFASPPGAGPYEVNPNCTGKLFNPDGSVLAHLVIVDGGKEVYFISLAPGVTSVGVMKRVGDESCSNASLEGTYGFYRSGTRGGDPVAAIAFSAFDGTGAVGTASQTVRRNGVTTSDLFVTPPAAGRYEVDPDCTGKFLNPDGSDLAHIVLVDGGKELYFTSVAPGLTAVGVDRKISNHRDGF
jgi:hypothetical protein